MQEIIFFQDVNVKIGQKYILTNINFKINSGDFILLLGVNGSGKTTLLKSMLGFVKITSGIIYFNGEKIQYERVRNNCGYVPQRLDIDKYFPIMAEDVINFSKPDKYFFDYLIQKFKIKEVIKKPFGLLSGGERQKVLLTMALVKKPDILFLDEPNLNLDINAYEDFLNCLELAKKEFNPVILMVTHLISIIPKSANKVFVMKQGKIVYKETPSKIFKIKNIAELIYG